MELKDLKKIGPKSIQLLNKLNINTIYDLVNYFPYRYNIYQPINLSESNSNDSITINVIIDSVPRVSYIRKNLNRLNFKALQNDLLINVSIFNRVFIKQYLDVGKKIALIGKYDQKKNTFIANDLKLEWINNAKIEPVYHIVNGLKNSNLNISIMDALKQLKKIDDYIPDYLNDKYNFINKLDAIKVIHNPKNIADLKQAKIKLIYEELFIFMLKINFLKLKNDKILGLSRKISEEKIQDFIKDLPFELTSDQKKAVDECLCDLASDKRMNRLIQGDVGSGKTIVAIIIMYANTLSGYQSALMAPTELLATQHYHNIKKLLEKYNIKIGLLVGSQKKSERIKIIEKLKNNEIDIIVGTHALIGEDVIFNNLGLVITDEQHRFGVNQRNNLHNKGQMPDIIYMSATPIPRTYALIIYKDMDISIIKTKPSGRKEIKTYIKKEDELKTVLHKILEEIKLGHQIYVIAPTIEEKEENNYYDVESLKKSFDKAFKEKIPTAILHGKIKNDDKEKIMEQFTNGDIKILIATTVIEVGVDVKNATTIVIFNAEMYGLATLHQLRGRVGRNDLECFCYLISNKDTKRLKVLEESNDGFYISEQDFLLRKSGDLFGTKQSGDMVFKVADLHKDFKILLQAKKDSEEFLKTKYKNDKKYLDILKDITNLD